MQLQRGQAGWAPAPRRPVGQKTPGWRTSDGNRTCDWAALEDGAQLQVPSRFEEGVRGAFRNPLSKGCALRQDAEALQQVMLGNNRSVGVGGWTTANTYQGSAGALAGDAAFSASVAFAMPNIGTVGSNVGVLWSNWQSQAGLVHARGWFIGISGANTGAILYAGVGDASALGGVRLTSPLAVDAAYALGGFNVVTLTADATDARLYWNGSLCDVNPIGSSVLASTRNPVMGAMDSAAEKNPADNATIMGAAYSALKLNQDVMALHWLQCQKAGRMADGVDGGGAVGANATFDRLYDAWVNNRGDTANLVVTANPAQGNAPQAAATWNDSKAAGAVNLTRQGTALYTVGHAFR